MAQDTPIGPRPAPEDQPRARDAVNVKTALDAKLEGKVFTVRLANGEEKTVRHGMGMKPSGIQCTVIGLNGQCNATALTAESFTVFLFGSGADRDVSVLIVR